MVKKLSKRVSGTAEVSEQEKSKLLKSVSLFATLQEYELEVVAEYSEYYPYKKDQVIFEEGSSSQELFIIKKGQVLIRKDSEEGPTDVARFLKEEFFGELDLLDETPRSASAVAEEDSVLLVFPKKGVEFRGICEKHPELFVRILYKLLIMIAGRIRSTNTLISQRTPWIEELRKQLLVDKLTGLYNRTYLEEDLAASMSQMGETTSVVVVKPDNFKRINDTFGHDTGDHVLRLLADTVKSSIRDEDIGIRYRGDEFCLVLPGSSTKEAEQLGEEVRKAVEGMDVTSMTEGQEIRMTASVGVSSYPEHGADARQVVARAFEVMLQIRESGGNGVRS
jgi:diguanylate cyclase (GGDEF)-like protein